MARKQGNGTHQPRANGRGVAELAREAAEGALLYETKNPLPAEARAQVVALLNDRLADCADLQSQCKQAHWNVKGPQFIALHKLFDDIYEATGECVDRIRERRAPLGGSDGATGRAGAARSP